MIINGVPIDIKEKEIVGANILKVQAGTNGYKGGDTGHGSRTFFGIYDVASTDMRVIKHDNGFEVRLGGDSELETIIEALKFIVETLEKS